MVKRVRIWICPDSRCNNYFASSSGAPDLRAQPNRRTAMRNLADEPPSNWGQVTGTRDECPDCRNAGRGVAHRVPVDVSVEVPEPVAPVTAA